VAGRLPAVGPWPGHVIANTTGKETYIGELDGRVTERVTRIAEEFNRVGLVTAVSSNILGSCGISCWSTLPPGPVRHHEAPLWRTVQDPGAQELCTRSDIGGNLGRKGKRRETVHEGPQGGMVQSVGRFTRGFQTLSIAKFRKRFENGD